MDVKAVLLKGRLSEQDAAGVVEHLANAPFAKINFAGGEPTLCPWLPDLIRQAKGLGMATSLVTNGSRINAEWLDSVQGCIDIIALSIDSVDPETLVKTGRAVNNRPLSADDYARMAGEIRLRGIRLKVNTVVTSANCNETLATFIGSLGPERWKIFQVLPVDGQNNGNIDQWTVTAEEFAGYVARNRDIAEAAGVKVVPETNELMTGSYAMVDPAGRFFDNTAGRHTYSRPILEVGVSAALQEVTILPERFAERGGQYE